MLLKLAVQLEDAAQIDALTEAARALPQPCLLIGMGLPGLVSRVRYRQIGSPWCYVAADAALATAPGQLDLEQLRLLGWPETRDQPFFALLGGPQIVASPGPVVYNRLFRQRAWPWSYLPVLTQRPFCFTKISVAAPRSVVTLPSIARSISKVV